MPAEPRCIGIAPLSPAQLYATRKPRPGMPAESRYGGSGLRTLLYFYDDPATSGLPPLGPLLTSLGCVYDTADVAAVLTKPDATSDDVDLGMYGLTVLSFDARNEDALLACTPIVDWVVKGMKDLR